MSTLTDWNQKMKDRRKDTAFHDFVREMVSWQPITMHKYDGLVAKFPHTDRVNVVSLSDFMQQRDTLVDTTGMDYDFSLDFFANMQQLFQQCPLPPVIHFGENENCDFGDTIVSCRNVYLSWTIISSCENVCYCYNVKDNCTNVYNSLMVWDHAENVYNSVAVFKSMNVFYAKNIVNSYNIWFSTNLQGCKECLLCDGLENQSYCIYNKKYEKEAYMEKKAEILSQKDMFQQWYDELSHTLTNYGSDNVTGNLVVESTDVENGRLIYHVSNARNIVMVGSADGNKNFLDVFSAGSPRGDDYYFVCSAGTGDNYYGSCHIVGGTNIYYSYYLEDCSYCLGCVGLQNKSYCIFNKQYTKEERHILVDKIFSQMEQDEILGQFFPGSMCPYYFNDSIAYLIDDSFMKEDVVQQGYLRRDEKIKIDIPAGMDVVYTKDLDVGNYDESILQKVIKDPDGNYYRIVKMEYDFLKKHDLPLPQTHRVDRMKQHFTFQ